MFKNLIAKLMSNSGQVTIDTPAIKLEPGAKDSSQSTEPKLDGLVQDIDFSDVPDHIRSEVIAKVTGKVKDYDIGVKTKFEDLAEERKQLKDRETGLDELSRLRDEIKGNPALEKQVTELINKSRAGLPISEKKLDNSLSKIEQAIASATEPEQREQLRQLQDIIKEESVKGVSSDELASVKQELADLKRSTNAGISSGVDKHVEDLSDRFGKDLVGKYAQDIKAMAFKYPEYLTNGKFSRILYNLADDSEIDDAVLKSAQRKKEVELKRKEAGTFPGSTSTPSAIEIPKDKSGRTSFSKLFSNMKVAGAFKR